MAKRNYFNVQHGDFQLTFADAKQTAKNLESIFVARARWFSLPKPISIDLLEQEYRRLCPDMEVMFPGVVAKMMQPEILRKLGFPVGADGLVHWSE
ncbi:hypothetical protein GCM10027034_09730 [Ramlibacter solisilvae]|uniref:Uncharacterized protein n=1 Tax=Ramlibacter tataouinensis TaxID=94132 RepID=A0A127K133_9BURK|nr:hypothetical protein UC35_19950 [Ramlibacter tataouinensis]